MSGEIEHRRQLALYLSRTVEIPHHMRAGKTLEVNLFHDVIPTV